VLLAAEQEAGAEAGQVVVEEAEAAVQAQDAVRAVVQARALPPVAGEQVAALAAGEAVELAAQAPVRVPPPVSNGWSRRYLATGRS
jgi:hypothetical protein